MTRIKLCGLSRKKDILAANSLMPEYVGFVFWEKSRRYVSPGKAETLRKILAPEILSVGVFVDEDPENIAALTQRGVIDLIQLHGQENEEYISSLRTLTEKTSLRTLTRKTSLRTLTGKTRLRTLSATPIIKAFKFGEVRKTTADYVMIDSGMGTGQKFDWSAIDLTPDVKSRLFIAGGLTPENVGQAIRTFQPFAVDVSSGIETKGVKDKAKMTAFVDAVRANTTAFVDAVRKETL